MLEVHELFHFFISHRHLHRQRRQHMIMILVFTSSCWCRKKVFIFFSLEKFRFIKLLQSNSIFLFCENKNELRKVATTWYATRSHEYIY